jgi:hypothetical protein
MSMHQYFVSCVFSSIGLALVTINPMTTLQAIFISIHILLSVFFMAWLYGEFSNQLNVLKRQEQAFQNRIDLANTTMEYLHISPGLRRQVRKFIKKTNYPREKQKEFQQFTDLLRKGLNHKVNYETNRKIILNEYCIEKTHLVMLKKAIEED